MQCGSGELILLNRARAIFAFRHTSADGPIIHKIWLKYPRCPLSHGWARDAVLAVFWDARRGGSFRLQAAWCPASTVYSCSPDPVECGAAAGRYVNTINTINTTVNRELPHQAGGYLNNGTAQSEINWLPAEKLCVNYSCRPTGELGTLWDTKIPTVKTEDWIVKMCTTLWHLY